MTIARIVEKIDINGTLSISSIQEVTVALDFMMADSESKFLVDYIRWRLENQIAK